MKAARALFGIAVDDVVGRFEVSTSTIPVAQKGSTSGFMLYTPSECWMRILFDEFWKVGFVWGV